VNVSPIQLMRGNLVAVVERILAKTGLPARRLQIEITESVLLRDDDRNLALLHDLRNLGVTIVLDDFGTGFSSLGYLNRFPLDEIKIDRCFVERLGVDARSTAIVAAVTNIARAFQATTVAEGVETEEQYRLLRMAAVSKMQGYLFGAPLPAQNWSFVGGKALPTRTAFVRVDAA
jgi:EAL domain-containing protein (putative c-di-GMP-specific phosphodiesterase class I)